MPSRRACNSKRKPHASALHGGQRLAARSSTKRTGRPSRTAAAAVDHVVGQTAERFAAEAAADLRGTDPQAVPVEIEGSGDLHEDRMRALRRRPDGELAVVGRDGQHRQAFHRRGGHAGHDHLAGDGHLGRVPRAGLAVLTPVQGDVGAVFGKQEGGAVGGGVDGIDD